MVERIIGHIDMDAFFASVEERDKPYLKGAPVIVGSDPQNGRGRGVVSTANYKARELGVRSALPIRRAWELCEVSRRVGGSRCVFVTSGFHRYETASREVFKVVESLVPTVVQTSIDEAYIDLSFCGSFKKAKIFAKKVKREVKRETNLTCSVGIGGNNMIAKICSDYGKPDGLTIVMPEEVEEFLRPLSIRILPGVGKIAERTFRHMGIRTVADAQKYSWEEFEKRFGSRGFSLWERVRGIDERNDGVSKPKRKSIGKHHTFAEDTHDAKKVLNTIRHQITAILADMRKQGLKEFRTVMLTVRFADFVTVTRSLTLSTPISSAKQLALKSTKLLLPFFEKVENPKGKAIRLIGIRVEKFK